MKGQPSRQRNMPSLVSKKAAAQSRAVTLKRFGNSSGLLQRDIAALEVVGEDPSDDTQTLVRIPGRPDLFIPVPANNIYSGTMALLSAKVDGYPGGKENSKARIFNDVLVPEIARECGQSETVVHRVMLGLGRKAQDALLRGQPVGIPYVGFLHPTLIPPRDIEMTDDELIAAIRKKRKHMEHTPDAVMRALVKSLRRRVKRGIKKVIFRTTPPMATMFNYNIGETKTSWAWNAELKAKLRDMRLENRLRYVKKKNKYHTETY